MSDVLRRSQWALLEPLLARCLDSNPFQRARFGATPPRFSSLEQFQEAFPFTTKAELAADQAARPPHGSNLTFPPSAHVRFSQTSGTTASPLAVLDTLESWDWLLENWQIGYALAGVRPGMVAFFAFSFGPFLGFWTAFEAGVRMGLRCLPGGGLGTLGRLDALLRHRVEVLCCTPTYALHLASVARKEGIPLSGSSVRTLLVAGEPGGSLPHVRSQLAEAWPAAEIIDHYGMTEVGPVAFSIPGKSCALRLLEDRYLVEIIDPHTLRPVEEGETGELVLTPLGRAAWPLFRYRTGDLVRSRREGGERFLEGGILGRSDQMLVVRGVNVYPAAVEDVVRSVPGIEEYRVLVREGGGLSELELEIESSAGPGTSHLLANAFERAFALRVPVRVMSTGSLPRFEFKARRWYSAP